MAYYELYLLEDRFVISCGGGCGCILYTCAHFVALIWVEKLLHSIVSLYFHFLSLSDLLCLIVFVFSSGEFTVYAQV